MNLHPIVIAENIRYTTQSAARGRSHRNRRIVWSAILFVWAVGYFAVRM